MSLHRNRPGAPCPRAAQRSFPGKRWVVNALRALHLIGVVGFAAHWLATPAAGCNNYCLTMVGSGLAIVALDWWANRDYWLELKGLGMALKLALVAVLVWAPELGALFWAVLVMSVLVAHAPGRLRGWRWWRAR